LKGKLLKFEDKEMSEDMKAYTKMVRNSREDFKERSYIQPFISTVDVELLAKAFKFNNVEAAQHALADGRVSSTWQEFIAETIYNVTQNPDKNGVYDLYYDFDVPFNNFKQSFRIGVKSLTKRGVDLTQSKWKGRDVKLTHDQKMEAFISSVMTCDYHIVADINEPGTYYFLPVSSLEIIIKVKDGLIKNPVINRKDFYEIFYNKSLQNMIDDGDFAENC
jgi:hypothetical protein